MFEFSKRFVQQFHIRISTVSLCAFVIVSSVFMALLDSPDTSAQANFSCIPTPANLQAQLSNGPCLSPAWAAEKIANSVVYPEIVRQIPGGEYGNFEYLNKKATLVGTQIYNQLYEQNKPVARVGVQFKLGPSIVYRTVTKYFNITKKEIEAELSSINLFSSNSQAPQRQQSLSDIGNKIKAATKIFTRRGFESILHDTVYFGEQSSNYAVVGFLEGAQVFPEGSAREAGFQPLLSKDDYRFAGKVSYLTANYAVNFINPGGGAALAVTRGGLQGPKLFKTLRALGPAFEGSVRSRSFQVWPTIRQGSALVFKRVGNTLERRGLSGSIVVVVQRVSIFNEAISFPVDTTRASGTPIGSHLNIPPGAAIFETQKSGATHRGKISIVYNFAKTGKHYLRLVNIRAAQGGGFLADRYTYVLSSDEGVQSAAIIAREPNIPLARSSAQQIDRATDAVRSSVKE